MKCPNCEHEIVRDDVKVEVYEDMIEVRYQCQACGHDATIGFGREDIA
jgi:predicted RNA-binding Zn-ribbon protein involved in translation (DUF1610 family)